MLCFLSRKIDYFFFEKTHGSHWVSILHYSLKFINVFATFGSKEWKTFTSGQAKLWKLKVGS